MRYGTRITTVEDADGDTLLNDGYPVFVHSILISNTGGNLDAHIHEGGVVPGSDATNIIAHFPSAANTSFAWYPYAVFDKGVLVKDPGNAGLSITVVWRPDG